MPYTSYKIKKQFDITEFFTAFERKIVSKYNFSGEMHDFWEMVFVVDGEIRVSAEDNVISLNKNQIIFHKPMEFHKLQTIEDKKANLFIISFGVSGKPFEYFSKKVLNLTGKQVEEIMSIIYFLKEKNKAYDPGKLITTYLEPIKTDPVFGHKLKNLMENFFISLSENKSDTPEIIINSETKIYKMAVNILETRIYSNITIEELAKQCNVSPAYIKRVFSKYAGFGIHEYFIKSKIALAKTMLASGISVTSTAEKLSFSSQNYFSVVFKREEGISPSQYKKQHPIVWKNNPFFGLFFLNLSLMFCL